MCRYGLSYIHFLKLIVCSLFEPTVSQCCGFDDIILLFSSIDIDIIHANSVPCLLPRPVPSKHAILKQVWVNVGPASATLAQHSPIIVSKPPACWIPTHHPDIILILHKTFPHLICIMSLDIYGCLRP